jgi:O-methyltransferase
MGHWEEILNPLLYLEGDYAECGVWRGDSAVEIRKVMSSRANLHLFDSFEGHAEPTEEDNRECHPKGRYADTSLEAVRRRLPQGNVFIYQGFIPSRFAEVAGLKFRFVHVDVDHYEATKACIDFFRPRMVKGGLFRFDDWTSDSDCPGAMKAIREAGFSEGLVHV